MIKAMAVSVVLWAIIGGVVGCAARQDWSDRNLWRAINAELHK